MPPDPPQNSLLFFFFISYSRLCIFVVLVPGVQKAPTDEGESPGTVQEEQEAVQRSAAVCS